VVALIMAMGRAMNEDPDGSVISQGFVVID
jgi:hypothetical protein